MEEIHFDYGSDIFSSIQRSKIFWNGNDCKYQLIQICMYTQSWFNESRFNEIPRFSEQMPAPFYYFYIVNSIRFSESLDLVNKSGLTEPIR